ncbi:protein kinase domain-containing protein, partial [Salmonella sp. SAL04284]|uniref:protein kinase domain-containing protein n=1 Tax=Salmonella sp. SAL04284 TaxID=3159862 RepID=UPI00397B6FAD
MDYTHQIAEGLDTAYKHGVVHRDIKPQNIVINSKDVAKITDFGLARSRETVTLTQSNVFMGTAYYI